MLSFWNKPQSVCFPTIKNSTWCLDHGFIHHSPRSTPKKFLSYWSASTLPETMKGILALGEGTSVLWTSCNVDKWRVLLSSFYTLQYSKAPSNLCHTNLHKYIYIYINILHLVISFIHFNTKQTKTMYTYVIIYNIIMYIYILSSPIHPHTSSQTTTRIPFKKVITSRSVPWDIQSPAWTSQDFVAPPTKVIVVEPPAWLWR